MLIQNPRIPVVKILLFGFWPNFFKIWLYRLCGFKIGKGVSIGLGSVIVAEQVSIGDHTSIGMLTILRGKAVHLGAHVQIGSFTFLDSPYIEIGEGSKINEQVFVGGLQDHDSSFVMGRNCQIMQMSFLNPARSIKIGDDSGIGGHSLIFGHSSWLSQLDGYTVDFRPIEIGNSVSIAWRVFVLPGSVIGDGSVVGADSLVNGTIPPNALAIGYPARVINKELAKVLSDEEKADLFRNIVREMIRYFIGSGLTCESAGPEGNYSQVSAQGKKSFGLLVLEETLSAAQIEKLHSSDVLLSLREIPAAMREALNERSVMWIDIARKEQGRRSNALGDEVSLYLKRYGIRTLRWPLSPPIGGPHA